MEKEFKLEKTLLNLYFFDRKKIDAFLQTIPNSEKTINFSNGFFNAYFNNPNYWTWDISEKAYALQKPIRIIQGRQDFLNDGKQELMNLKLKDSKIFYIERSGHFPWAEKPTAFFEILKRELKP